MDDRIKLLDIDGDVLSFDDCFMLKVGRFKEEIKQNFMAFAEEVFNYGRRNLLIKQNSNFQLIKGSFTGVNWRCSPSEGISCEVLCLGATSWQKGKLQIDVFLEFLPILEEFQYVEDEKIDDELRKKNIKKTDVFEIQVRLEFFPERSEIPHRLTSTQPEIINSEFPLERIRRIIS